MNIIEKLEQDQAAKIAAKREIPDFAPGDTVVVSVRVTEGERSRIQNFEGVVIARSGGGINESFTVRKISYGEGVERVFPLYSPLVEAVKVLRRGKVRRAKLYYLRGRTGKRARIAERQRKQQVKAVTEEVAKDIAEAPADDISLISGIGDAIAAKLLAEGITTFKQIAAWTAEEAAAIDEKLSLGGRIVREEWVEQAAELLAGKPPRAKIDQAAQAKSQAGSEGDDGEADKS